MFVKADIADQAGKRPGYTRKWMYCGAADHTAANHPSFYANFLKARHLGDQEIGYCKQEPWSVVQAGGSDGRPRDDQGKPTDGALRHGDLICMETPDENYAVEVEADRLKDLARAKRLRQGDSERQSWGNGGVSTYTARVGTGFEGTPQELLK